MSSKQQGPKNYQVSSYAEQAAEFERQHGNLGTPESASCIWPKVFVCPNCGTKSNALVHCVKP